jgi:small subunit ribosomal protein S4
MSYSTGPKCRLCRKEGEKLFLKGERCFSPKCALLKKNYGPGPHGNQAKKNTEYGRQLREKQKIKRTYLLTEKQLHLYYVISSRKGGDISNEILKLLEMRADSLLMRSGLVSSRITARQLIGHGHFDLNGKRITIPSIQLKAGDKLTVHGNKKVGALAYQPSADSRMPNFLKVDRKAKTIEIVEDATNEFINSLNLNIRLVVEFYSR